jgi:ATP-dependent DNA helicase RecG
MPIDIFDIDNKQLGKILLTTESHFADVKRKEIGPSKLTETISAFANADGGELFIGIAESGAPLLPHHWDGFADPEDANAHLQVFEELFPLGGDYRYDFLKHPEHTGYVLQVAIKKTKGIIRAKDGVPRIRRGAQNLPVDTPEKLKILERNKGITSFETELVAVDATNITNSETTIRFILDVVPSSEPEPWLQKQELIKEGKPTVAGVVLFSDLPQAVLPKRTGIKVYRYQTSTEEGSRDTLVGDPVTIEGCAYDLIREAVRITGEMLAEVKILGTKGFEPADYPLETLHEVITNAVLHRDYDTADDVHVRIFDNRIEVESPGRLPAHITERNFLTERFARNGNIVRLINKFPNPPNKDVGEGLNTAFEAMRKRRLRVPVLTQGENSVIVEIGHQKLDSPANVVMEYLENNAEITNQIARSLTGIKSENSMKAVFIRLRTKQLIEPVPDRTGFKSAWQKKSS